MTPLLLLIAIAVAAGIAVALQGQFMGSMDKAAGTTTSMFVTYGVGALLAAAIWLFHRQPAVASRPIPWFGWLAGLLGLVIGIGFVAPRLGLARTLVLTVAAQLVAAMVIDHLGAFGATPRSFDGTRALGLALTVGGVWLVVK